MRILKLGALVLFSVPLILLAYAAFLIILNGLFGPCPGFAHVFHSDSTYCPSLIGSQGANR